MVKVKLLAPSVVVIEVEGETIGVDFAKAREIIVGLAQAMDDGQHGIIHAFCASYHPDTISVSKHAHGQQVKVKVEDRATHKREHVLLSKDDAVRVALAMLSFAGEINDE